MATAIIAIQAHVPRLDDAAPLAAPDVAICAAAIEHGDTKPQSDIGTGTTSPTPRFPGTYISAAPPFSNPPSCTGPPAEPSSEP